MRSPIMKGRCIDWRYELGRARTRAAMKIAWRLPRWLVYWASIRLISHATTGRYGTTVVPDLTAVDALSRWLAAPDGDASAALDGSQVMVMCPMTHLPEMACDTCGKPVETSAEEAPR